MQHKSLSAFTFVELIIVVIILGILGTVGFLSYSDYIAGSRDANRVTQTKDIYKGLQLYATSKLLPLPDDSVTITASGSVVGYQGYAGENILQNINYTSGGTDPKDNQYFTYVVSKNKKSLQVLAFLEEQDSLETEVAFLPLLDKERLGEVFIPQTYAATDYSSRYPKSVGSKLGVILQENTNTPIQDIVSGELDVVTSGDNYTVIFNDNDTLTGSGTTFNYLKSNFDCHRIQQLGGSRGSGIYTINPTGNQDIEVYCDMETDGGGWTRVVYIANGDTTWNTWDTDETLTNSSSKAIFGMKMNQFSIDANGEDLEYMIKVDGEQKGPLYTDVDSQAWDNIMDNTRFDTSIKTKEVGQSRYDICNMASGLYHNSENWNWSITDSTGTGCSEYDTGGGFLANGTSETFTSIRGLNTWSSHTDWEFVEIWIR